MKAAQVFGLLAMVVATLSAAGVAHASQDQRASAFVLCKNRKDVRTIRVLPDDLQKDSCRITYSKGDEEQLVGSNRTVGACRSIVSHIQHNLESSHWSCRNVPSALITTSNEVVTGSVLRQ